MQNIIFLNKKEEVLKAEVKRLSPNTIQIKGVDFNTSGFHLINNFGIVYGKFDDYTTVYRELEDGYVLSNDGSVYVEPEVIPTPEPEPYIPTLEEVQDAKVIEMNNQQQMIIKDGVDITLTDGTVEHFKLTEKDQISLMGLQTEVAKGTEMIPWHTSDETEHCKFYSNADMKIITEKALQYVTYHVTYFRDLRIYIRSLDDVEAVKAVAYGMEIPEEYQSEPLKVMIAAQV